LDGDPCQTVAVGEIGGWYRGSVFPAEVAEANRRRLAVLLPLMILARAIHAVVFTASGAERAALSARSLRWHDLIALIHVATGVLGVPLALVARRPRSGLIQRALAPATGLLYLLHGALIAGADQLTVTSVTPFVGYALGTAVVLCLSPATALALYGTGLVAFVAAILSLQPSSTARRAPPAR
jgi:hypothetical protein